MYIHIQVAETSQMRTNDGEYVELETEAADEKDERPYKCLICGKSFARKEDNKVHLRTHFGKVAREKAVYTCRYCEHSVDSRAALTTHEQTHVQEKPHLCSQCGKRFASSATWSRHRNKTHGCGF